MTIAVTMAAVHPDLGFVSFRRIRTVGASHSVSSPGFRGFSHPEHTRDSRVIVKTLEGTLNCSRCSWDCGQGLRKAGEKCRIYVFHKRLLPLEWNVSSRTGLQLYRQGRFGKMVNVLTKKETGISRSSMEGRERKLEAADLLELEFGRLLGEDRQTTMAKVIGKKINPDLSYIEMEKRNEAKEARAKPTTPSKQDSKLVKIGSLLPRKSDAERSKQVLSRGEAVPELASPPVRPKGVIEQTSLPLRKVQVVPPVRFGSRQRSQVTDTNDLEGLVQKPVRVRANESGLPPVLPPRPVIPPMLMRTKSNSAPGNQKSGPIDTFLRRPAVVSSDTSVITSPQHADMSSLNTKDLQDNVDSLGTPETMSKQSLEGQQSPQIGTQKLATGTVVVFSGAISPLPKPGRLNFERRPTVLGTNLMSVAQGSSLQETVHDTELVSAEAGKIVLPAGALSQNLDVKSMPRTSEFTKHAKKSILSLKNTQKGMEDQLLTVDVIQSQNTRIANSSKSNEQESENVHVDTSDADIKQPLLKVENTDPVFRPVRVLEVDGPDGSTLGKEVVASSPLSAPVPGVELSPAISSHSSETNVELLDLSSRGSAGEESQDRTQQKPVKDSDRGIYNSKDLLGAKEIKVEGDMIRATQVHDSRNCPLGNRKNIVSLSKRPSPVASIESNSSQLNFALQSKLQKAVQIREERKGAVNKEEEDKDWARAEALHDSKSVEEVTIIGNARDGLLAAFGSLVGYIPAYELTEKKRPQSFIAWAQSMGVDIKKKGSLPSTPKYLVDLTATESTQESEGLVDSLEQRKVSNKASEQELLELYKEDRANYLFSLAAEKGNVKVIVTAVDRTLRQLRFSQKQAESEDQNQTKKKIQLMESLNVGDIVTCKVKTMTPIGAFVELQGVPALIHVSELSWNRNTDPLSVLQVGQEIEARVCKLDRFLMRINLSLKQMKPDPLLETLESLVSPEAEAGYVSTEELEFQGAVNEELNSVLSNLAAYPGISALLNGRRVRSSALAPAFQMYLSGPLDCGYKLLARFGNEVQEVLVMTSINREQMKEAIQKCMVRGTSI